MTKTDPLHVTIRRFFKASPDRIFDAWLDPKAAQHFLFTTPESTLEHIEIDPVVGGSFRFKDRREGALVDHVGVYTALERPTLIAFRLWMAGEEDFVDQVTITLLPGHHGTMLTLTHELHPKWSEFEEFTRNEWAMMFGMLDDVLRKPAM